MLVLAVVLGSFATHRAAAQPANDNIVDAVMLLGDVGFITGDNIFASFETNEVSHLFPRISGQNSVWFRWIPSTDGLATFDTMLSTFDTVLAVYTLTDTNIAVTNLSLVVNNDDVPITNLYSRVTFAAAMGIEYFIAVAGYTDFDQGSLTLNWSLDPGPTGDVQFTAMNYTVDEDVPGVATIAVAYSGSVWPVTVDFATTDGTATNGVDYTGVTNTVTFSSNQRVRTVMIPIIGNTNSDGHRTVNLTLSNPVGTMLGEQATAVLQILDNESQAGFFNFTVQSYVATENEILATASPWNDTIINVRHQHRNVRGALITVTRTGGTLGRVMVDFYTTNKWDETGTNGPFLPLFSIPDDNRPFITLGSRPASPLGDYQSVRGTLVFDHLQMSTNFIVVPTVGFGFFGGTGIPSYKLVNLVLTNPRNAPEENPKLIAPRLGALSQATLAIAEVNSLFPPLMMGAMPIQAFAMERRIYRVDEYGPGPGETNENQSVVRVDVILPGGGPGTVEYRIFPGRKLNYILQAGSDFSMGELSATPDPNTVYTDGNTVNNDGQDYVPTDPANPWLELNFPNGQTTVRSIFVTNLNDLRVEFNEDIDIELRAQPMGLPVNAGAARATVTILCDDQPAGAADREWNPDGVTYTDPPFNRTPGANSTVNAVAVQVDQKTVIGGEFTAYNSHSANRVARLNPDGALDPTFTTGTGADGFVGALALYPHNPTNAIHSGKVMIGGGFASYNGTERSRIARLNTNGTLDVTFNPGSGPNGPVRAVAVQGDGKVLIGGEFTVYNGVRRPRIARLNEDGSLDGNFDPGLGVDGTVWSIAIQGNVAIFAPRAAFGTELEDRNVVETGCNQGEVTIDFDFLSIPDTIRVYYDGVRILDIFTNGVGRLMVPYGPGIGTSVEIVMNEGTGIRGTLWSYIATILPTCEDKSIVIGGEFSSFDGVSRKGVARLTPRGSLDVGFEPGDGFNGPVYSVVRQAEGKVLVGGRFDTVDFRSRNNIARLNVNGSLDSSFDPGDGADDSVYSIALQSDGKALLGGIFTSFNQTRRLGIARLFQNGALDTSFLDTAYNQFAGLINPLSFEPPNFVNSLAYYGVTNTSIDVSQVITNFMTNTVVTTNIVINEYVMIGGSFTNLGGNQAFEANDRNRFIPIWTRQDISPRYNVARLIGGFTPGPGNIEFIGPNYSTDENAGVASITLRRIDGRLGTVQALSSITNRTALGGADFVPATIAQVWPQDAYVASQISVGFVGLNYLPVSLLDDSLLEGGETADLRWFRPDGSITLAGETIPLGAALGRREAQLTITDNDFPHGTFAFSAPSYRYSEEGTNAVITIIRTNGSVGQVKVDFIVLNGTATNLLDYNTPLPGTNRGSLTFNSDVTSRSFNIPLINDTIAEPDETIMVVLTNASGGATLPGGIVTTTLVSTVTIVDNDFSSGRANFAAATYTTNEAAGTAQISVHRSGGSTGILSVDAGTGDGTATNGVDYTGVTNTLTWASGDTTPKIFSFPLISDSRVDTNATILAQTVNLRLRNPSVPGAIGSQSNATLVIQEDDGIGALAFSQANYDVDENGTNVFITVVRRNGMAESNYAQYVFLNDSAVNGTHYTGVNGTIGFAPGETSKSIPVGIINNITQDGNKRLFLRLTNGPPGALGSPNPATLTIVDDESFNIPAGSLDTAFSDRAGANDAIFAVAQQNVGDHLIAAGDFTRANNVTRNRIARFLPTGLLDSSFNAGLGPNGPIRAMVLQPDDKAIIGGFFIAVHGTNRNHIARLNTDGTLDSFFNPGAGANNPVHAIALQQDGRVVIGGAFDTYNGQGRRGVAVLNTNGSLHAGFDPGVGADGTVFAVAVQLDGKILIGGDFSNVRSEPRNRIARLNADGSLDGTFDPGFGADGTVRAITVQPDGKILVGGSFTSLDMNARNRLTRLNTDGSVDLPFLDGGDGADNTVLAITLQSDGKILVVGDFTSFNGVTRNRITRLLPDGRTDPGINFGSGANAFIAAALIQRDRKIVICGGFTMVQDQPRDRLARLHGGSIAGSGALEFAAPLFTVAENAMETVITARRVGGTAGEVSVTYSTGGGSDTATPGADYSAVTNTLTFPEGEVLRSFVVPILNDAEFEPDETVSLTLFTNGSPGVALGPQPTATLIIQSDDSRVAFLASTFSVNENANGAVAILSAVRTGATNTSISVDYFTAAGSATAGVDYTNVNATLAFEPGDVVRTFIVPIVDDPIVEGDETVLVLLTNASANASLGLSSAVLTIVDNDINAGILNFSSPVYIVNEYDTNLTVTVERTGGSNGVVSVSYSTSDGTARAGLDYVSSIGTLTFADGVGSRTFNIPLLPDFLNETNESLFVALSFPSGGAVLGAVRTATVTISNVNLINGNLNFASTNYVVLENATMALVTVERGFGSQGAVAVSYRTAPGTAEEGEDYVGVTNSLSWLDGDTSAKSFSVTIVNSNEVESSEFFGLELFAPSGGATLGARAAATVTIEDDDVGPGNLSFFAAAVSVSESGSNAMVSVVRTSGSTGTVGIRARTVSGGTAEAGVDYAPVDVPLQFVDGETNLTFSVPVNDNAVVGGNKTVRLELSEPSGGASTNGQIISAVLTILDNELQSGSVDGGFGSLGANAQVYAVVLRTNDQRLMVGGDFTLLEGVPRNRVARLNASGTLDTTFDPGSALNGSVRALALQPDGRILVGGAFTTNADLRVSYLARLNPDGSVDTNFFAGLSGVDNIVQALTVLSDGRLLVGGSFNSVNGTNRSFLARLDTTGALDVNFSPTFVPNSQVRTIAVQGDGKILIGGDFTLVGPVSRNRIARLNADGTLDMSFDPGLGANDSVRSIVVRSNGRILVGGLFTAFGTVARNRLVQLETGGQVDGTFTPGSAADEFISAVGLQTDGKVVAVGGFTHFNGITRNRVTRLNADGSVDLTINFGAGANNFVNALAIQADNKIVVGGGFTEFDGLPRNYLARLNGGENLGSGNLVFSQAEYSAAENAGAATITVRRLIGSSNRVTVAFQTVGGTAVPGVDYTETSGLLAFDPGEVVGTFSVPILNNALADGTRALSLILSNATGGAVLGIPSTASLSILNDDARLDFAVDAFSVSENGANAIVTVQRSSSTLGIATVAFTTSDGSATAGTDYAATSGTLTFTNGQGTATFSVPILDDPTVEGNETVNLTLSNPSSNAGIGLTNAILTIVDDDFITGLLGFSLANFPASERAGGAIVTVTRGAGSSGAASVDYVASNGTATAFADYQPVNGRLAFADNESTKTFTIPILDDVLVEGAETINLTLSNPLGATLGQATATVTILADEAIFGFSTNRFLVSETATNALVTVTRSGGTGIARVDFFTQTNVAQAGLDYSNVMVTLVFDQTNTAQTVLIPILDDALGEGDESLFLRLTNVMGEAVIDTNQTELVIQDNDVSFGFDAANYLFNENAGVAVVAVARTGLTNSAVSVTFATSDGTARAGVDYFFTSQTVSFTAGETRKLVQVPLIEDTLGEGNEFLNLNLQNPSPGTSLGLPSTATLTIVDNEDTFSLSADAYSAEEGATNATVFVIRSGVPGLAVATVVLSTTNGTATAPLDFTNVTETLTFQFFETIKAVNIPIVDDGQVEGNETILLRLFNPSGGPFLVSPSNAVLTILDNDTSVAFTGATLSTAESGTNAFVTVRRLGGVSNVVTVSFTTSNGTATAGQDYTSVSNFLVFNPGVSNLIVEIPILDDLAIEGDETVALRLFNPSNAVLGALSSAQLTIVDNDSSTIAPAGVALIAEGLSTSNQVIDPGERVTLDFGLRNVGNVDTVSLLATLLSTNGITLPSAAQDYGPVVAGGPTVSRRFAFTASGTSGGSIAATFALRDGTRDLGRVSFPFTLGRATHTFSNSAGITINDLAPATPYPSSIVVSNVQGAVVSVTVRLLNMNHTYPDDVDILLVGPTNASAASPTGDKVMLMSDAGGSHDLVNVTLEFDDAAALSLANSNAIVSGSYRPSNFDPDTPDAFGLPQLVGPFGDALAVYQGKDLNGRWDLYVIDDARQDAGNVAGGWSLSFLTTAEITPSADVSVVLTDAPDPIVGGGMVLYTIAITNHGPGTASNIVVTNLLQSGLAFVSATNSSGSFTQAGGVVTFDVNGLSVGGRATMTVVAQTPATTTNLTLTTSAGVRASVSDQNPDNNAMTVKTSVMPLPGLMVSRKDDRVVIAWPQAAGSFLIEQTVSLTPPNWQPATNNQTISGGFISITVDPTGPSRFYRLRE